jgi:hypothetical protein
LADPKMLFATAANMEIPYMPARSGLGETSRRRDQESVGGDVGSALLLVN